MALAQQGRPEPPLADGGRGRVRVAQPTTPPRSNGAWRRTSLSYLGTAAPVLADGAEFYVDAEANYALAAAACTYLAATRGPQMPVGPDGRLHRRAVSSGPRPSRRRRSTRSSSGRSASTSRGLVGAALTWAVTGG